VLRELRYDALNAGTSELLAGPTALRELAAGAPALISANAAIAAADAPSGLVKPYVIKEVAGRRIALVGVTDGGVGAYGNVTPTRTPADALRALLPEVRAKADLIVVLADVNVSSVRALADEHLDIDVLLGARASVSREPTLIGSTVVANAGGLSRYVDRLTLEIASDGRISSFDYQEASLDESVPDDPGIAQLRDGYRG
jgi:2',3'-cyclic-nucleotide 2'-phosphodiesterase (5'-nucleotidase family)